MRSSILRLRTPPFSPHWAVRPLERRGEELPADMLALLQAGTLAWSGHARALAHAQAEGVDVVDGTRVRHAAGEIKLLAPLPRPNSLRDYMVVEEHVRNCCRRSRQSGSTSPSTTRAMSGKSNAPRM